MSLNDGGKLREVAKIRCRELRKNQTKAEMLLWDELRNRKFLNKKFYRQYPLFYDVLGKETFYIVDFYNHERQIAIEVDGKIHEHLEEHDELRTEVINSLGISVIRFKNEAIEKNIGLVLKELKEYILESN